MKAYHLLLEAQDSRTFLKKALELVYYPKKPNLADFSRRAQFQSRSYLSEFLNGKKELSPRSFLKIRENLDVPFIYLEYFHLLLRRESPEFRLKGETHAQVNQRITSFKAKAGRTKGSLGHMKKSRPAGMSFLDLFVVYAAMGTSEEGATLQDIRNRTGLPASEAGPLAENLVNLGFCQVRESRYHPTERAVDLVEADDKDAVESLIKDVGHELIRSAPSLARDENALFFATAFSIKAKQRKALRKRLLATFLSVVEEFQDDDGDMVVKATLSSLK